MSKVLIVDLDEALLQFPPAIWGGSDLNEAQAKQLAKKLVKLLVQRCNEEDVIEFEAEVDTFAKIGKEVIYYIPIPKELIQRVVLPDSDVQVFVIRKEK